MAAILGRSAATGVGDNLKKGVTEKSDTREIAMREITMDSDNVHCFYGRKNYLSSFFEAPMLIAGHMYPTVEHYYEACKVYALAGPYQAVYLKNATDPGEVKALSKRILGAQGKGKRDTERWKRRDGLLVIRVGLMEKFRQNPKLRAQLFKTGDSLLVQCNQYDTLWSAGLAFPEFKEWLATHKGEELRVPALVNSFTIKHVPDIAKGKNLLGFMLMYVRDCLKSEYGKSGLPASVGGKSVNGKDEKEE
jgi:ribA/ribD-fused uncharacterized protein